MASKPSESARMITAFAEALAAHPDRAPGPTELNRAMGLNGRNKINGRLAKLRAVLLEEAGFVKKIDTGRWVPDSWKDDGSDD